MTFVHLGLKNVLATCWNSAYDLTHVYKMADFFRALVETMKFLDAGTLLLHVALVSHQWKEYMDNTEIWNVIISDMLRHEIVLDPSQTDIGNTAFRTYLNEMYRYALVIFNDDDRILEETHREEAERRNEVYTRTLTELHITGVPGLNKKTVKLSKDYIHAFHSTYVWVPPFHLFVAGGRIIDDKTRQRSPTYLISLRNYAVGCLEDTEMTNSPSLVYYQQFVYSFGGSVFSEHEPATCLKTARKFALSELRWLPLKGGDMPNAHCYSWAERYHSKIFIVGGFGSNGTVDEFDISTETFRTIPVTLSSRSEAVLGIRDEDTLHCLSGQKVITVRLSDWATGTQSQLRESSLSSDNVWMWASPVIVLNNKAYFVLFDTIVYTYELDTKKFMFKKPEDN